jgi:hypothetical protein
MAVIESMGCGVLDAPLSRGMTAEYVVGLSRDDDAKSCYDQARQLRRNPP